MKGVLASILLVVLAACAQNIDLTPMPHATAADPEWIRKFDAALIEKETELLANHGGSLDSHVILWEELYCIRGVHVAQARAAQALSERKVISRGDAIRETQSDPGWTIAVQQCRQSYQPSY